MFRKFGLGKFSDLLVKVSKDPAMIFWLDNCENHKNAINENYGRELLELFSMGVGMDGTRTIPKMTSKNVLALSPVGR
ncbi:MAG: hypothetical protein CM1200mP22_33880 [Dehalococcoidia bacterium]|nr:MAG: hypothetical protein CM1200mP22_33880 [Dehalococcoidia bacterium]